MTMDIVVLGYEDCLGLGFIGTTDLLLLARRMLKKKGEPEPFNVITASYDGNPFRDGFGRYHSVDTSFLSIDSCSAIIIPPFFCNSDHSFPSTPTINSAAGWVRRQHALGAVIAASCNGVFIVGEAGLLNERRCTTAWWRYDEIKSRYPRADIARGAALIEDNRVVTAGGPLSWVDLSINLIQNLVGSEAAKKALEFTIVHTTQSSQAVFVPPACLSPSNSFQLKAEEVVRQAADKSLTSVLLANVLGVSERTLHRRIKEATGERPKHFIDRVRFETARMLLETSTSPVKQLARTSGFSDETSFRRAFRRYSGMTPGAYRSWSVVQRGIKT
jgi:transcriptional regulator GlxA family with amidase domain